MTPWTRFECPCCHEPIQYSPADKVFQSITEEELKTGRGCIIVIECPHCPETMIINRETGQATRFSSADISTLGSIIFIWDMTFTEKGKEEVQRLNKLGDYIRASNPRKAAELFRKALRIRKHDPYALYNLGVCQHELGDLAGAEKNYRQALIYNPNIPQVWNNLGCLLAQQYRLDEGNEIFDRGIAVDANNPKFYLGKGNIAAMRGDFAGARRFMNLALQLDPHYQLAHQALKQIDMVEKINSKGKRKDKMV